MRMSSLSSDDITLLLKVSFKASKLTENNQTFVKSVKIIKEMDFFGKKEFYHVDLEQTKG
jgi:hypothetical protein